MLRWKSLILICLLIEIWISGAILPALSQTDLDLRERFLQEAPQKWEDYLRFASRLQVKVDTTRYKITNGNRSRTQRFHAELKQGSSAAVRILQSLEPDSMGEAEGTNPSYSFALKQSRADDDWSIAKLTFPGHSTQPQQKDLPQKVLRDICDCLTVWNLWLPTLIHDPDFKIRGIQPNSYEGEGCIWIEFEYLKNDKDYPVKGSMPIKGGWLVLDTKHDWIMREYTVHCGNPDEATYNTKFDVRERGERHPIVLAAKEHITVKNDKLIEVFAESKREVHVQSDPPIEEFTLSAFGLPEPMGVKPLSPSRTWLWLLLATVASTALAILFAWLKRRRSMARQ